MENDRGSAFQIVLGAATLAALLQGCALFGLSDAQVAVFSEPPGARVVVDGRDSGFVTPCHLTLDMSRHEVELRLPGYAPGTVSLEPSRWREAVLWKDMSLRPDVWRFPLWLNLEDSVEPVKFHQDLSPGHVFVRLQRAARP